MSDTISIAAVGDIMLGDSFYHIGYGVRSVLEKEKHFNIFDKVKDRLNEFDLVIGNLESVLSDIGLKKGKISSQEYRGNKEFVRFFSDANFSVLSVANNHIMQHGKEAMLETISTLEDAGMLPSGLPDLKHLHNPEKNIISVKGMKIACLAYCLNLEKYTQNIVPDVSSIYTDVEFFRSIADKIIVILHWGIEYMSIPSPQQIKFAHKLVDLGADIILGHHPHTLQGIEIYKEKIIAYSLGNFVFDHWLENCRKSIILNIIISKESPISYNIFPTWINDKYQPIIQSGEIGERIKREVEKLSLEIHNNHILVNDDENKYLSIAASNLEKNRKLLHKFIFKQLPKLSINLSAQLILRPILRRLVWENSSIRRKHQ